MTHPQNHTRNPVSQGVTKGQSKVSVLRSPRSLVFLDVTQTFWKLLRESLNTDCPLALCGWRGALGGWLGAPWVPVLHPDSRFLHAFPFSRWGMVDAEQGTSQRRLASAELAAWLLLRCVQGRVAALAEQIIPGKGDAVPLQSRPELNFTRRLLETDLDVWEVQD